MRRSPKQLAVCNHLCDRYASTARGLVSSWREQKAAPNLGGAINHFVPSRLQQRTRPDTKIALRHAWRHLKELERKLFVVPTCCSFRLTIFVPTRAATLLVLSSSRFAALA